MHVFGRRPHSGAGNFRRRVRGEIEIDDELISVDGKLVYGMKFAHVLELLAQHTVRAAEAGDISARQLANVAYGASCSDRGES